MATIINASNSTGLTLTSDLSGVLQLQQNGVALPALSVAPAFSAYVTSNYNVTGGAFSKAILASEDFDTNNNFDSTTNYRFTPTVAGYYQLNWEVLGVSGASTLNTVIGYIYKNGTAYAGGQQQGVPNSTVLTASGSTVVYANGTTDYFELYVSINGSGTMTVGGGSTPRATYFSGSLIRGA